VRYGLAVVAIHFRITPQAMHYCYETERADASDFLRRSEGLSGRFIHWPAIGA
jgi:hypothetical protein